MRAAFIFLLFIALAGPAQAQLPDAVAAFDAGSTLLRDGAYREALGQFERAEEAGYVSAELEFHRGIAHFRIDELGLAIRHFERARRMDPGNRFVAHSLEIARSRISEPISRLPVPLTVRVWRSITRSPVSLFAFGLLAYLILLVALVLKARRRTSNDWIRRVLWVSGTAAAVLIGLAFWSSIFPPHGRQAVVVEPVVQLRLQADAASDAVSEISEGIMVQIESESGVWFSVRLPNGVAGWIPTETVAEI